MTYLYAILAVLVTGLICLRVIRSVTHAQAATERRLRREMTRARKQARIEERERTNRHVVLKREKLHVPTPWGWPGQAQSQGAEAHGRGSRWRRFATGLSRGNASAADATSAEQRLNRSIRALLEDRYAPVHIETPRPLEYQKVKPPRLRDPSQPHDQMDNFGTARVEPIRSHLPSLRTLNGERKSAASQDSDRMSALELKGLKQPWGW